MFISPHLCMYPEHSPHFPTVSLFPLCGSLSPTLKMYNRMAVCIVISIPIRFKIFAQWVAKMKEQTGGFFFFVWGPKVMSGKYWYGSDVSWSRGKQTGRGPSGYQGLLSPFLFPADWLGLRQRKIKFFIWSPLRPP